MNLKSLNHIYECNPPVLGNAKNGFIVKLKLVPKPEFDAQALSEAILSVEARVKSTHQFMCKYFAGIEGLAVDGEEIKTLDDIFHKVPMELYSWIYAAIMTYDVMTKAEIKN